MTILTARMSGLVVNMLHNSSNVKRVSPIVRNRCLLADLTVPSHNSLKCEACGSNKSPLIYFLRSQSRR